MFWSKGWRSKDRHRYYIYHWRDGDVFEMDHCHNSRRVVNLSNMTCSCGRWQLNGISCPYACATIFAYQCTREDFVHECYRMDAYKKAYALSTHPIFGLGKWPKVTIDTILPPLVRTQSRHQRKVRR